MMNKRRSVSAVLDGQRPAPSVDRADCEVACRYRRGRLEVSNKFVQPNNPYHILLNSFEEAVKKVDLFHTLKFRVDGENIQVVRPQ